MKKLLWILFLLTPAWAQPASNPGDQALQLEQSGRLDEAQEAWLRAIGIYEAAADSQALARAHFFAGRLAFQRKLYDLARQHLERSRDIFAREKVLQGQALAELQLGLLALERTQYTQAESHFRASLQLSEQAGDRARRFEALGHLARVLDIARRWPEAVDCYRQLVEFQRAQPGSELAENLTSLASLLQMLGRPLEAEQAYRESAEVWKAVGEPARAADPVSRLARMFLTLGQFDSALQAYDQILQWQPESLVFRANRAYALEHLGREREALQVYQELLRHPQAPERAAMQEQVLLLQVRLGERAQAYERAKGLYPDQPLLQSRLWEKLGEPALARECLEQALTEWNRQSLPLIHRLSVLQIGQGLPQPAAKNLRRALQEIEGLDSVDRATLLVNLAETYLVQNQYPPAFPLLEEAVTLWRKTDQSDQLMTALNNLASAHQSCGRWEKALELLREAQQVGEAFQKPAPIQGTVTNFLGFLYVKLGRVEDGIAYYEKALSLRRALRDRRGEILTLSNLGTAQSLHDRKISGRRSLEEALEKALKLGDLHLEAVILNNLAHFFPEDARALSWSERAFELTAQSDSPSERAMALFHKGWRLARGNQLKAGRTLVDEALKLWLSMGSPEELVGVWAFYLEHGVAPPGPWKADEQMLALVESSVQRLPSRLARSFVADKAQPLRYAVQSAYQRSGATGLLETEERVRALGVLALTRGLELAEGHLPPVLSQRRRVLEERLAEMLRGGERAGLADLKREYRLVCEEVERHLLAAGVASKARSATLEELRSALRPEELLVEYVDLPADRVAVLVDSQGIEVVSLGKSALQLKTPRLVQGVSASVLEARLEQQGQALLQPWLARVKPQVKRLVVIPTRDLYSIPWMALTLEGRPLIEAFQVESATSATAWLVSRQSPRAGRGTLLAALGDANPPGGLTPLPGTLKEIQGLARKMPRAQQLVERKMTRQALETQARGQRWLHLATHGVLDPQEPLLGGLACSDGMVTVGELFKWRLDAEVAVLSACQSGRIEHEGGLEYVGLSQAFQCAGTRSLLVSLWSVADEETALWMNLLYQGLGQGKSLAEATQQAALAVRKQHPHPYFWAAFSIWGDGSVHWVDKPSSS